VRKALCDHDYLNFFPQQLTHKTMRLQVIRINQLRPVISALATPQPTNASSFNSDQ
jgi:hypothetical protein